jgi:hypothetical protein
MCVQCNGDTDCAGSDNCNDATCVNNVCTKRPKVWANCGSGRVCGASGVCEPACGNKHVDTDEQCDPTATGWDDWSCNRDTCRTTGLSSTTSFHRCSGPSDCSSGETCKATTLLIGLIACIPTCTAAPARTCPIPPGYNSSVVGDNISCDNSQYDCVVLCSPKCPPGIPCQNGVCYAP